MSTQATAKNAFIALALGSTVISFPSNAQETLTSEQKAAIQRCEASLSSENPTIKKMFTDTLQGLSCKQYVLKKSVKQED